MEHAPLNCRSDLHMRLLRLIMILALGLTTLPIGAGDADSWQTKSVDYARIMSRVKWTPVTKGMPKRGGYFEPGKEYTGVPYSSVKHVGRYIGFDIFLKTFLAAVENPKSVLYTENLQKKVSNDECYYGKGCSSYTLSRIHTGRRR